MNRKRRINVAFIRRHSINKAIEKLCTHFIDIINFKFSLYSKFL